MDRRRNLLSLRLSLVLAGLILDDNGKQHGYKLGLAYAYLQRKLHQAHKSWESPPSDAVGAIYDIDFGPVNRIKNIAVQRVWGGR